jgi:hypothetical protein
MEKGSDTPANIQAEVLRLHEVEGLSYTAIMHQIKERFGVRIGSLSTVSNIVKRKGNRLATAEEVEKMAFGSQIPNEPRMQRKKLDDLTLEMYNLAKSMVGKIKGEKDKWTTGDLRIVCEAISTLAKVENLRSPGRPPLGAGQPVVPEERQSDPAPDAASDQALLDAAAAAGYPSLPPGAAGAEEGGGVGDPEGDDEV